VIPLEWDTLLRQDASTTWGAGGFSSALGFWWQTTWEVFLPDVCQHIKILSQGNPNKISSNVLELVIIVINFFRGLRQVSHAGITALLAAQNYPGRRQHINQLVVQNSHKSALTKLISFANKHMDIAPKVGHILGILNYLATTVSRGDLAVTISEKMAISPSPTAVHVYRCKWRQPQCSCGASIPPQSCY
jgi:hypothetical protein